MNSGLKVDRKPKRGKKKFHGPKRRKKQKGRGGKER